MAGVRYSGLQRSVLALYRRALRALRTKPAHARPKFLLLARHAFRARQEDARAGVGEAGTGAVRVRDVDTVEALVRRMRRKVEVWEDRSVRDCWVGEEVYAWGRERGWVREEGGKRGSGNGLGGDEKGREEVGM